MAKHLCHAWQRQCTLLFVERDFTSRNMQEAPHAALAKLESQIADKAQMHAGQIQTHAAPVPVQHESMVAELEAQLAASAEKLKATQLDLVRARGLAQV